MTTRSDWETAELDALVEAFLTLRTPDEMRAFLRDLCTHKELSDLSHRWAVARLVDAGLPYREVAERAGASTATVARVAQWLRHGEGGYRIALDRVPPADGADEGGAG